MSDRIEEYKEIMSRLKVGMNVYDTRKEKSSVITGINKNCRWRINNPVYSCTECIGLIQLDNEEYGCHSINYNFWLTIYDDFLSEEDMEI